MTGKRISAPPLVWGSNGKDRAPPVSVENTFLTTVSRREFQRVKKLLGSRAPKRVHPRRASSPDLLSGLLKCEAGRLVDCMIAVVNPCPHPGAARLRW